MRRRRNGTDLTFHLREPDPDFLDKLALPYAFAVPAVARPRTVCRSLRTGTASEAETLPPCAGGCVARRRPYQTTGHRPRGRAAPCGPAAVTRTGFDTPDAEIHSDRQNSRARLEGGPARLLRTPAQG
jgi:hypothetical protein